MASRITLRLRPHTAFTLLRYLFLALMTVVTIVPFAYMLTISFTSPADALHIPVYWFPPHPTLDNYRPFFEAGLNSPLLRSLANSVFVATAATIAVLIVDTLAAFGFTRLKLPGTNAIFGVILLSLMVPVQVTLIPIFLLMRDLHFLNSYNALVWPATAGAFGVFLLRQFFQAIPIELEEAAGIDGANVLRIFWSIDLPMVKNALVTLAVLTWLASWNDFFWPLIALSSDDKFTAPIEITALNFAPGQTLGPLMAAAALVAAPPLLFYVIFQRRIRAAVMTTGLAGR